MTGEKLAELTKRYQEMKLDREFQKLEADLDVSDLITEEK